MREAWLVDLRASRVEVYAKPRAGRYTKVDAYGPGGIVMSTALDRLTLAVDAILP